MIHLSVDVHVLVYQLNNARFSIEAKFE